MADPDLQKVHMMLEILDGGMSPQEMLGWFPDRPGWWQNHWTVAHEKDKVLHIENYPMRMHNTYMRFVCACLTEIAGGNVEWKKL